MNVRLQQQTLPKDCVGRVSILAKENLERTFTLAFARCSTFCGSFFLTVAGCSLWETGVLSLLSGCCLASQGLFFQAGQETVFCLR